MQDDPLSASASSSSAQAASDQPSTSYSTKSAAYESKATQFRELLGADVISLRDLKALAYHGVPEEKGLRAAVWKASRLRGLRGAEP